MDANTFDAVDGTGAKIGIVRARFNEDITGNLLNACKTTLEKAGVGPDDIHIVEVPGAVEVPYALNELAHRGGFDALIGMGCIIKGGTPHFDLIARMVHDSLATLAISHRTPVIAGVITCLDHAQAIERSGPGPLNRGVEAAHAALEMVNVRRQEGWDA